MWTGWKRKKEKQKNNWKGKNSKLIEIIWIYLVAQNPV